MNEDSLDVWLGRLGWGLFVLGGVGFVVMIAIAVYRSVTWPG